jgi:hypothetical protein
LIVTTRDHTTAVPRHRVLRHWRMRTPGSRQR